MKYLLYLIVYSLFWVLSKLPDGMLYAFSGFLFRCLYYFIPYRKKVTLRNISRSFPEKNDAEVRILFRKFYRFFCDVFVESLTSLHWPEKKLVERYSVKNNELIESHRTAGRNVMLVFGHYANWEWFATYIREYSPFKVLIVYKPLHNKYFDRWIQRVRMSRNSVYIPSEHAFRAILEYERQKIPYLSLMLSDQRPLRDNIQHWITFMNQDTPVFLGPEKIARKTGQVVVFMNTRRLRRGHYQIEFEEITRDPKSEPPFAITDAYFAHLEKLIREEPELYLWSHKRWKFERPVVGEAGPAAGA